MREDLFGLVADSLPFLISYIDAGQRYRFNNRSYEEWFGRSREELYGRTLRESLGETAYETVRPYVEAALAGHKVEYETMLPYRDAGPRDVRAIYAPHFAIGGKVLGFAALIADVTEQRRIERKAWEQAEAASRMKDQFLATLSHELRTPLNAILGWTQILRTGLADAGTLAQGLEAIERSGHAQAQLVDDLLDVSSLLSGKLRLEVESVSLPEVVEEALAAVAPAAEARKVRVESHLGPVAGAVTGDPRRLRQVVWNLVSNAVKFTPEGGRVEVRLERVGTRAELRVSDTGEGIDPEFLPYVFDLFRQADASTTRRHGGLGLGLSIVRQIVEMHGGTVRTGSEGEGKGAAFTVSLPLAVFP